MLIKETALRRIIKQIILESRSFSEDFSSKFEQFVSIVWNSIKKAKDKEQQFRAIVDTLTGSTPSGVDDLYHDSNWAKNLKGGLTSYGHSKSGKGFFTTDTEQVGRNNNVLANVDIAIKYALGTLIGRIFEDLEQGYDGNLASLWHNYELHTIDAVQDHLSRLKGKKFNANNPSDKMDIEGYIITWFRENSDVINKIKQYY